VDVPLDGDRVAVVEVETERLGVELVDIAPTGMHRFEGAVHAGGVNPVEVDAVRVAAAVREAHPDPIALGASDGGPRNLSVVGPRRIEHAGRHFDLMVFGDQLVLPQPLTRGETRDLTAVEMSEEGTGIE
jgi:hypothetical protein